MSCKISQFPVGVVPNLNVSDVIIQGVLSLTNPIQIPLPFPSVSVTKCFESLKKFIFNRYTRKRPKVDASIFDSALSHTRRSAASQKKKIASPLFDVFACGQVSSPRLYRLTILNAQYERVIPYERSNPSALFLFFRSRSCDSRHEFKILNYELFTVLY